MMVSLQLECISHGKGLLCFDFNLLFKDLETMFKFGSRSFNIYKTGSKYWKYNLLFL